MLGVRLEPKLEAQLAALASARGRTKSDIAREAVRRYVLEHDAAYREECRRQSRLVATEAPTADDMFWDNVSEAEWDASTTDDES